MSSMQAAVDAGYDEWGVSATHTDGNTAATTDCTVVLDFNLTQFGDAIQVNSASALVNVRRSEITSRPRRGDTFTTGDGTTYDVDQVLLRTEFEFQVLTTERNS